MTIKKLSAVLCAFAMSTAMLTACGDSDSSASGDSKKKDDTTTTTTTAADAEVEDTTTTTEAAAEPESQEEATTTTEAAAEPASFDFEYQTKFEGYDAFMMFADSGWRFGNWNGTGEEKEGFGIDADITGDGEYTVKLDQSILGPNDRINENADVDDDGDVVPANGAVVWCIDIIGICDGTTTYDGSETGKTLPEAEEGKSYANVVDSLKGNFKGDGSDVKVTVTSIKADGEEVEFDASKIIYGNIEDANNKFRIEIYNEYGATKEDPPLDVTALSFKELEVTFTIEGLGEVGPFDTPAWAE